MKRVFEGKLYDTDDAQKIEWVSNNLPTDDFGYFVEALYRTEAGAWFLAGEGGAMTEYATEVGGGRGAGSRITPLSPEEALEWLATNDMVDAAIEHFGDRIAKA